jgi:hypothetical protein
MASQLIPAQGINLSSASLSRSANLSIPSFQLLRYSDELRGWQLGRPGAKMNFQLDLPEPQAIQLSLVMSSTAVNGQTNNPMTLMVNNFQLFTQFDAHGQTFDKYTFYIPSHWLKTGGNALRLSLDGNATTSIAFRSIDVVGISPQVNEATNISFEVPSPVSTDILTILEQQGTQFDPRNNAWQIQQPGKYVTFDLYLDQPRLVAVSMNFRSTASGGLTNNPFTITVNGKTLLENYDPHIETFHDEQWLIPSNWVVTGNNKITVTLAGSATTGIDYKRFGAAAQVLPPGTMSVSLKHNNGRIDAQWPTMASTSYEIQLYLGSDSTTPSFTTTGFFGTGIVFPQTARPGTYSIRVRPWMGNVAGTWTDLTTISIHRTILFLSSADQAGPAAARLAVEGLGVVVYANVDNLHFEALASDTQVAAARSMSYFNAVYSDAMTAAQIAGLPAAQRRIAETWNYYYSIDYQRILADKTNKNLSWGDPAIGAPPISHDVPTHLLRAIVEPSLVAENRIPTEGEHVVHMPNIERHELKTRLLSHLDNPTVTDALAHSLTTLPERLRERAFEPQFRDQLFEAAEKANPKVAMRGIYAVGVIIVQSTKDEGGIPVGWETSQAIAAGAKSIPIGSGSNDPQPGDVMNIDGYRFKVEAWDPITKTITSDTAVPSTIPAKAKANVVPFTTIRKGPRFSETNYAAVLQKTRDAFQMIKSQAPQFRPHNWVVGKAVAAGATTVVITGGQTFPRPGDTFSLSFLPNIFQVHAFDIKTLTISAESKLPATAVGEAVGFDDRLKLNLEPILLDYTVNIDVGFTDYNLDDPSSNGSAYWVLPAVAEVVVAGQRFPATWDGLESLRQAVKTRASASNASLIFLSEFPSDWFAFATASQGLVVMARNYKMSNVPYTSTISRQLDARDQAAVRTWLNNNIQKDEAIPRDITLAITVDMVGHRWHVAVQHDETNRLKDRIFTIVAIGSLGPSTLAISAEEPWGLPRWHEIIAHEIFHLFNAPDEYSGVGTPCVSCGGTYGVYNIPNGNCASCANPLQACIMNQTSKTLCDYTRAMIGWSDVLVEVTTDPTSKKKVVPMSVKLGDGLLFPLSDPVVDRRPGPRDPYALGYTRLQRADISMIAVGNEKAAEITMPWKVKRIRVWLQGSLIYDQDNLGAAVDIARNWLFAPGFDGNIRGYEVTITTGTRWFAGTLDEVYLTLGGKTVALNEYVLTAKPLFITSTNGGFPAGSVKTIAISPKGIDFVNNRTVMLKKQLVVTPIEAIFGGDDWFPAHIRIIARPQTGREIVVLDSEINTWLGVDLHNWYKEIQRVP